MFEFLGFEETIHEYRGHTDLDKIICPHCEHVCFTGEPKWEAVGWKETMRCSDCKRLYFLMTMQTPLGLAWQTWDKDPRPALPQN